MFYLMHTKDSTNLLIFVFCNQSSHITKVWISEGSLWLNTMINSVCTYCNVRRGMCTMKCIFGRTEALG